MNVSYNWLQVHIDAPLPTPEALGVLLTTHAYELEGIEHIGSDYKMEFDVQPNRAHDSFGHKGVAKEISILTGLPEKMREEKKYDNQFVSSFAVDIQDIRCKRYMLRELQNISVQDSPKWMKERLEVIGQRSINTIVDSTNIVMFDRGQPMHAFDADKIVGKTIFIREAVAKEAIITLDGKEVVFDGGEMVIADEAGPLAIAGIKGGKRAEVDAQTKNILFESASFDAVTVRMTRRKLGIETESSKRFERDITSSWAEEAMNQATDLVYENAFTDNSKISEIIDIYPRKVGEYKTGVSLDEVNSRLGTNVTEQELSDIFTKLQFTTKKVAAKETFVELAKSLVGVPYVFGASVLHDAPNGFDCSSYISYCAKESGLSVPRMTIDQYVFSKEISKEDLEIGDLVFSNRHSVSESNQNKFKDSPEIQEKIASEHDTSREFMKGTVIPNAIDHGGIYLGDDTIIHCTGATGVTLEKLSESDAFKDVISYRRIFNKNEERFVVTVPDERIDIRIKEDVIEEVARMYGYNNIAEQIVERDTKTITDPVYYVASKISKFLVEQQGFSELLTYVFQNEGEVELLHPLAQDKKFMRSTLLHGMKKSLELNIHNAYLLGVGSVKMFEIGKVFAKNKEAFNEHWSLSIAVQKKEGKVSKSRALLEETITLLSKHLGVPISTKEIVDDTMIEINLEALAEQITLLEKDVYELSPEVAHIPYKTFSPYPFVLRDIAVWVPSSVSENELLEMIKENAGDLLVTSSCFDTYEKDGNISYAFRLVFQSYEVTLTDEIVSKIMDTVTKVLNKTEGFEVR